MTALIDADSIVWIIAYNYRDEDVIAESVVKGSCDDFISSILTLTQADRYLGVFSSSMNFRHLLYKYQPYKGHRPPKPDFIVKWADIIKQHFTEKWGFYTSPNLEADDIVVAIAADKSTEQYIICTPDKDLKQVAGLFFDYKKNEGIEELTPLQACVNLWAQVLTGDTTDNIAGLPGLGAVKVNKLFEEAAKSEVLNDVVLMQVVKAQFLKYYGPFYGEEIYVQTLCAVMMIQPNHPLWNQHKAETQSIKETYVRNTPALETGDELVLDQLGWDSQFVA